MKLLLDENLSDRIVPQILDLFPEATHVKAIGLKQANDSIISEWAKRHGFTLVSKDSDFTREALCSAIRQS